MALSIDVELDVDGVGFGTGDHSLSLRSRSDSNCLIAPFVITFSPFCGSVVLEAPSNTLSTSNNCLSDILVV